MQLPDIRQLRTFIALAETRGFTAAAKRIHVTQSAVSHSIKGLETQIGCTLFERVGKRIVLTPQGDVFLHHAQRALNELESGITKLEALKTWGYSGIKLGASDTICQYVLPNILVEFTERFSKCEIIIEPGDTTCQMDRLRNGTLDMAFGIEITPLSPEFTFHPFVEDTLCFITRPDHPWVDNRPSLKSSLPNTRLITYSSQSATTRLLLSYLQRKGVRANQSLTVGNMEAIKEMTLKGLGVGVVTPWVAREEINNGSLHAHRISNNPPNRLWGMYTARGKTFSHTEDQFLELCKRSLRSVIQSPTPEKEEFLTH